MPSTRFWVTTTDDLEACGPLGDIWHCVGYDERPHGMTDFETLGGAANTPREQALGRRWQMPMHERWAALSPLRAPARPKNTQALRSGVGSGLLDHEPTDEREELSR